MLPPQSHTQIILWSQCRIDFLRCDLLSVGIQIRYKYSAAVGNIYFLSTVGGKMLSVDIFPDGLLSVNTLHLWSPSTRWRATSPLVQPPDRLSTQLLAAENHLYAFGGRDARWCETIISLAPSGAFAWWIVNCTEQFPYVRKSYLAQCDLTTKLHKVRTYDQLSYLTTYSDRCGQCDKLIDVDGKCNLDCCSSFQS